MNRCSFVPLGSIVSLNGLLKTEYSLIPEGFFILSASVARGWCCPTLTGGACACHEDVTNSPFSVIRAPCAAPVGRWSRGRSHQQEISSLAPRLLLLLFRGYASSSLTSRAARCSPSSSLPPSTVAAGCSLKHGFNIATRRRHTSVSRVVHL